jgi:hypothetical protein
MSLLLAAVLLAQVDPKIDEFARTLKTDDELATKLRDTLLTAWGKPALKEQIATLIADAKKTARDGVVPAYFKEHFDDAGKLRDASKPHAEDLLRGMAIYEADIKELKAARDTAVAKIPDEPEHHVKLKKFLATEEGLHLLYFTQLRLLAGRDEARIEKHIMLLLEQIVAPDMQGNLVLREDMKDKVDALLADVNDKFDRAGDVEAAIKALLPKLADDGDTGKLKKALTKPGAAAIIARNGDRDRSVSESFDEVNGKLVLKAELADKLDAVLAAIDEAARKIANIKGPCDRICARLRDEHLRDLLKSDVVRLDLATELKIEGKTIGSAAGMTEAFDTWAKTIFTEADGKLVLQDAHIDKIRDGLRKAQREAANYTAPSATLKPYAEKLADETLKAFYLSLYGRVRMTEILTAKADSITFSETQGLEMWIAKHTDGGAIREASRATVESLIAKAEKIRKELEKNDINPGDK